MRNEAVFGLAIAVPARKMAAYRGFPRWAHQLWLDVSSAWFCKTVPHYYLRPTYDIPAAGLALALPVFAFVGSAAALVIAASVLAVGSVIALGVT